MMSSHTPKPKRQKIEDETPSILGHKVWGKARGDFETTYISLRTKRNVHEDMVFEKVQFGLITANIAKTIYKNHSRIVNYLRTTDETMEDIKTKLLPMKQTLTPLDRLKVQPSNMNGTWGIYDVNNKMPPGLCSLLLNAFMHDMDDNNGKIALRELLACVVNSLNLDDTLFVAQTGGSSPSQFATCMSKQVTVYTSPEEDSQSPEKCEGSMDSPSRLDVPAASSSSISPAEPERSPCFSKPKLCTADVLVYSIPHGIDNPIRTHLVVSLKKGKQPKNADEVDIIEALLSRLPYQHQFGSIYGVLINSCSAKLFSVKYEGNTSVIITEHNTFGFDCKKTFQSFNIGEFHEFLLDIALILKSQS